jgi:hypothetical protein
VTGGGPPVMTTIVASNASSHMPSMLAHLEVFPLARWKPLRSSQ